jgi:hypothetical protein
MEVSEVRVFVRGRSEEYSCCFPLVVQGTVSIHVSTYTFSPTCPTRPDQHVASESRSRQVTRSSVEGTTLFVHFTQVSCSPRATGP